MATDYVSRIRSCTTADLEDMLRQLSRGQAIRGWHRGKAFEHIILRAFEIDGAEVVWPFEVRLGRQALEQIDGAVYCDGLSCLVEAKDYAGPINIEPLAKLRNQFARRPSGTLGLVFARSGFTDSALYLARLNTPLNVLLWDFGELEMALTDGAMRRALVTKYRFAVERGVPDFDVRGGYR